MACSERFGERTNEIVLVFLCVTDEYVVQQVFPATDRSEILTQFWRAAYLDQNFAAFDRMPEFPGNVTSTGAPPSQRLQRGSASLCRALKSARGTQRLTKGKNLIHPKVETLGRPCHICGVGAIEPLKGRIPMPLDQTSASPDKPTGLTATIRRAICRDQKATVDAIRAQLAAAGFADAKQSTITTIRADTLATLREATALGLMVSATPAAATPATTSAKTSR
jgi:hypothetical protein